MNTCTVFRPIVACALIEVYFSQKCLFEKNVFGQNNEREIQCMVLKKSNTQKKKEKSAKMKISTSTIMVYSKVPPPESLEK